MKLGAREPHHKNPVSAPAEAASAALLRQEKHTSEAAPPGALLPGSRPAPARPPAAKPLQGTPGPRSGGGWPQAKQGTRKERSYVRKNRKNTRRKKRMGGCTPGRACALSHDTGAPQQLPGADFHCADTETRKAGIRPKEKDAKRLIAGGGRRRRHSPARCQRRHQSLPARAEPRPRAAPSRCHRPQPWPRPRERSSAGFRVGSSQQLLLPLGSASLPAGSVQQPRLGVVIQKWVLAGALWSLWRKVTGAENPRVLWYVSTFVGRVWRMSLGRNSKALTQLCHQGTAFSNRNGKVWW